MARLRAQDTRTAAIRAYAIAFTPEHYHLNVEPGRRDRGFAPVFRRHYTVCGFPHVHEMTPDTEQIPAPHMVKF